MRWFDELVCRLRQGRVAALACALAIPVAAGLLATMALGQVFSRSELVPVAVVNEDRGATTSDGRELSAGDDLVDDLLDSPTLAWSVVDEETADAGLESGSYALVLRIPEDYSECVASLETSSPEQATIEMVSSGSENVLATSAGSAALRQVQARVRADVGENYLLGVLNDVRGQASRLTLTADGSVMLDAGYDALSQGADALAEGMGQIADASGQLDSGLEQIAQGVDAAGTGAAALGEGMSVVGEQMAEPLAQGAEATAAALDAVSQTTTQMGSGIRQVADALQGVSTTLEDALGSAVRLAAAGPALSQQATTLSDALSGATSALEDAQSAVRDASEGISSAFDSVVAVRDGAAALSSRMDSDDELAPGLVQRLQSLDVREAELDARVRDLALDATLSAEERSASLEAIDAERAALSEEREALLADLSDIASASADLAQTSASAVDGLSGASDASASIDEAAQALDEAAGPATDALEGATETVSGLAGDASGVARGVLSANVVLDGVEVPGGNQVPGAIDTLDTLGQGVDALGTQLSSSGGIGAGLSGVATGTRALGDALSGFAGATGQLATGNATLASALRGVAQGTSGLAGGLDAMASAAGQLGDGVDQLKEASGQVVDAVETASESLSSISGDPATTSEVVARSVSISNGASMSVDGIRAAAPLAIVAALWLGGVLLALSLPAFDMRAVAAASGITSVLSCSAAYALLGAVQGLLGAAALLLLGVGPEGAWQLAGLLALTGVSGALVSQALRAACGRFHVGVSLAALGVQAVCAGALLPSFFASAPLQVLGSVLPVPLVTQAIRSLMAGSSRGVAAAVLALVVWCIAAVAISCMAALARRQVRPERVFAAR